LPTNWTISAPPGWSASMRASRRRIPRGRRPPSRRPMADLHKLYVTREEACEAPSVSWPCRSRLRSKKPPTPPGTTMAMRFMSAAVSCPPISPAHVAGGELAQAPAKGITQPVRSWRAAVGGARSAPRDRPDCNAGIAAAERAWHSRPTGPGRLPSWQSGERGQRASREICNNIYASTSPRSVSDVRKSLGRIDTYIRFPPSQ